MTNQPPLDLDAVMRRYDLANTTQPAEPGETVEEWRWRMDQTLSEHAFNSSEDVPDLVAEIRRLRQSPPPGSLDGWRTLARRQIAELVAKDALIHNLEEASARQQVEIERLRQLLDDHHHAVNRDPDWYIEQCAADKAFHQMGDQP